MKKYLLIIVAILGYSTIYSQTVFDANTIGSSDIKGTARYMSMGGAFGALGGDASAIVDNPAGLGIYRKSELSTTLNMQLQNSSATWYGENASNNKFSTKFNNFTYVIALPTWRSQQDDSKGLLSSNWSFSYNQVKNYDRNVTIKGGSTLSSMTDYMNYFTTANKTDPYYLSSNSDYNSPYDNTNVSWLSVLAWNTYLVDTINGNYKSFLSDGERVSPNYQLTERGHINKYSFAWSGNFSNKFYLGTSIDYTVIDHTTTSIYDETFQLGGDMSMMSNFSTKGAGVGLNIGAIYKPTYNLRLGFAFHSPTIYSLTDHSYSDLYSDFNSHHNYSSTPNDSYYDNSYLLQSPLQLNASVAYVFNKGILSAEYVYNNTTAMKLMDSNGSSASYDKYENNDINTMLKDVHTLKLGAEYRITDNFSVRAGYAFKTASADNNAVKYLNLNSIRTDTEFFINNSNTNYFSCGFGYHENSWFLDFAYQRVNYSEDFYPYDYNATEFIYNNTKAASVSTSTNNLVATLGLKF
ncbi:MAG: outer membrane protein transport protein [Bacteroidota bacterium]|nr:outer membrane protein transport protein [Bacteroidota bacterium]